jgi:3-phytase
MARPAKNAVRIAHALAFVLAAASSAAAFASPSDTTVVRPYARVETEPVPHRGDAADTPDIWVHPTDPARSLVIATDKKGALMVYDLDGRLRQVASAGSRPNDVSVLYGFTLGGRTVDVAVAGCRPLNGHGVKVWVIDEPADTLRDVTAGGVIPVFGGAIPYGTGVYKSPKTGRCYFFASTKAGKMEQYQLEDVGDGTIAARRVRAWHLGSVVEGCVADNELGNLFLSEERVGIWRFDAEPDGSNHGELIARVWEHGLTPDVEGLSIYYARGGAGYLIASGQGGSVFNVYARDGDHRYLLTIDPQAGAIGDVHHTDGIAVTSCPTSPRFPRGLFVAQDGSNSGSNGGNNDGRNQNFKLYGWEDIAGTQLVVDTLWSPRTPAMPPAGPGALACARGGNNEPLLETESGCLARPGTVTLGVGFERGAELHGRTRSAVPFALDYTATSWLELSLEPIVYSRVDRPGGNQATGSGDFEVAAIVTPLPEGPWRRAVAFALEVNLPTASHSLLGSRTPDYTLDLVLGRPLGPIEAHANVGYTIVGGPAGSGSANVYSFSVAALWPLARFDLVAEVLGHTRAAAGGDDVETPELATPEVVGTIGAQFHVGDRMSIGLGVSHDRDRTLFVSPLVSLKLR